MGLCRVFPQRYLIHHHHSPTGPCVLTRTGSTLYIRSFLTRARLRYCTFTPTPFFVLPVLAIGCRSALEIRRTAGGANDERLTVAFWATKYFRGIPNRAGSCSHPLKWRFHLPGRTNCGLTVCIHSTRSTLSGAPGVVFLSTY